MSNSFGSRQGVLPLLSLFGLALLVSMFVASAATAASGPNITVRIEGENATLVEKRDISLDYNKFSPPAPWPGSGAPANSIAAALETSLNDAYGTPPPTGHWDRGNFVSTILTETHAYAYDDFWGFWQNHDLVNKGASDGGDIYGLDYGDDLLIGASVSVDAANNNYRPAQLPVELSGSVIEGAAAVPVGTAFPLEVTAFMPQDGETDMPPGPSVKQRKSLPVPGDDYTVVAIPEDSLYDVTTAAAASRGDARSGTNGAASLTIDTAGNSWLKAVREYDTAPFGNSTLGAGGRSPAVPVCAFVPNTGDCGTAVISPENLDLGDATRGGIGDAKSIEVAAPNAPNTVNAVRVFGPDAEDFMVSAGNCVDTPVAAAGNCRIQVRLAPTATGNRNATLRIHNSSESLGRDLALSGTGIAGAANQVADPPKLRLRVTPARRGVKVGKSVVLRATVSNVGIGVARDLVVCLRRPAGFRSSNNCAKTPSLAAGTSRTWRFRLRAARGTAKNRFRNANFRATAQGVGFSTTRVKLAVR